MIKKWMIAKVELVSPAFIGGAVPRTVDEYMPFRPSAIRGALRYWFRAAIAPRIDWGRLESVEKSNHAVDFLHKMESTVFGSMEKASPIMVQPPKKSDIEPLLRRYPAPDRRRYPGLRYLGYGLFENQPGRKRFDPLVLHPPEEGKAPVELVFSLRGPPLDGLAEVFGATVWLWTHLGGIGARMRRGWGSLRLSGLESNVLLPYNLAPCRNRNDLLDRLNEGLRQVDDCFDKFIDRHWPRKRIEKADLKTLATIPMKTVAGLGDLSTPPIDLPVDFSSWSDALDTAGKLFQDYRSTLERRNVGLPPLPDYFEVKRLLSRGVPPKIVNRASFGMPLPFYFRSLGGKRATFEPKGEGCERIPSALLFRPIPMQSGKIALLLLNFARKPESSVFLGKTIEERKSKKEVSGMDSHIIEQFIAWARNETARSPKALKGRTRP